MKIIVKDLSTTKKMYEDGAFRCAHEEINIEEPCCDGHDCGCYGLRSIYCVDCENTELTEQDAIEIMNNYGG